jgi:hypothetical protein
MTVGSSSGKGRTDPAYSENVPLIMTELSYYGTRGAKQTQIEFRLRRNGKLSFITQCFVLSLAFVALYPIMFFACLLLPTWWSGFTWKSIQDYQMYLPSKDAGYYFYIKSGDRYLQIFPVRTLHVPMVLDMFHVGIDLFRRPLTTSESADCCYRIFLSSTGPFISYCS